MEKEQNQRSLKEIIFEFWCGYSGRSTGLSIRQTAEKFGVTSHTVRNYFKEAAGQMFLNEDEHLCVIEGADLRTGCGSYRDHGLVDDPLEPGALPHSPNKGGRLVRNDGTVPMTYSKTSRE